MLIGVPKEIKNHEYRVGLTPSGVRELVNAGHEVLIETLGGDAIGMTDEQYEEAGAVIVQDSDAVFEQSELIVKVKEPQQNECTRLHEGQTLFTYLHLAADRAQTEALLRSGATCIAYETVTDDDGSLPLLTPMSEVAGRISIQAAAHCLEKTQGGNGVLMGGVPGVAPAKVCVIGGGVVGLNAARMALGLGADVTILDRSLKRLKTIDETFEGRIGTLFSNQANIESCLGLADAVIGAVLIPGAAAPKVVTRQMLSLMKPGSVMVDVAIDQGGCFETSRPTTHENPTYAIDGINHYCVTNMPGAAARTSTQALTNATLPFVMALANKGTEAALTSDSHLLDGLNIHRGVLTSAAVGNALKLASVLPNRALDAQPLSRVCSH